MPQYRRLVYWQIVYWQIVYWQIVYWQIVYWQIVYWQIVYWHKLRTGNGVLAMVKWLRRTRPAGLRLTLDNQTGPA